ncbi:single-stranded DNA-binding protein [Beijerinckia indica]|uniref:Single-strand binding protein/Primosomal replication protein n n=1 Tax=Beijerinckia indica subsp. indica (strain ATCC 9039 / DSM 1715 / NCIMB 8712) TaxID=395963 RepID=B2ICC9_BEII9|nr:single-stranded DNA-binding protein [Beijerinckia indica]ACB96726.1 single-strand binding protein/Primosomal replication protein n [Beijerinckia indica subsp. indica ATCC 9039]
MSAVVLVSGTLFRAPERKTSKAGRSYVSTTLREREGTEARFWQVTAFSDHVIEEFLRLSEGDAIAVQGQFRAELYDSTNGPRISLSVVADHVLVLNQPKKKREPKPPDRKNSQPVRYGDPRPFDDDVSF